MKKSFFLLLTVTLAAIFSFSACSDDKDDKVFVKVACDVYISSSDPETSPVGSNCWELSGYFPESEVNENIAEAEDLCQGYIALLQEELSEVPNLTFIGSKPDKCQPAFLECEYTKDGETTKFYFSELIARMRFGGKNCPKDLSIL